MEERIRHLKRTLGELIPFEIVRRDGIDRWESGGVEISPPHKWEGDFVVLTRALRLFPPGIGRSLLLVADFGGEALVKVDGKAFGELNELHGYLDLTPLADGEVHELTVEVVPRGLFGRRREGGFRWAYLVVRDEVIHGFLEYTSALIDLADESEGELKRALIDLLEDILGNVWVPRSTEIYRRTVRLNPTVDEVLRVWNVPEFPECEGFESEIEGLKNEIEERFERMRKRLETLERSFPKTGRVILAGHSHIDYAWLWPISETRRKLVRTFSNALRLIEKYGNFVFVQSSAQMYEDVKNSEPELYEEIKNAIKAGRWEVVGGSWLENDCNIPSIESLIRQFYYGQRFFEEEFGKRCEVAWFPDVFGFPWTLPQILKEAGLEVFVTTKLTWNDTNEFPYDLCVWRGIDGSEVIYYSFKSEDGGYNGTVSARHILSVWRNFKGKGILDTVFSTFGYGDGGGGPTDDMVERVHAFGEFPGTPKTEIGRFHDFVQMLKRVAHELKVWDGELYLELHRGTYTSQLRTKMLHDRLQEMLRTAEILNAYLDGGFQSEIEKHWKVLLRSEFHDILPGSSISEVYGEVEEELRGSIGALEEFVIGRGGFKLFNPSSFRREQVVLELQKPLRLRVKGREAVVGRSKRGYVHVIDVGLDPLETVDVEVLGEIAIETDRISRHGTLENEHMKVVFESDGSFNIYSKDFGRWVFSDNAKLVLHKNVPYYWDNWEIDRSFDISGKVLKALRVEKVEENVVREVMEVEYDFEGSKLVLDYILEKGSRILKVEGSADWHTRRVVLKAVFSAGVLTRKAIFDLDGGFVERPTTRNTDWEKAMFEVPFQRWIEVREHGFGLAVLTNFHHGASVEGSTIGLTLVKAGIYPDFLSDEGELEFEYAIFPNGGDIPNVVRESDAFTRKVVPVRADVPGRSIVVSGELKISSFRKERGKYELRLVEFSGSRGECTVEFRGFPDIASVKRVNILGDALEDVDHSPDSFSFDYEPFKIYTFEIEFA